MGTAAENFDEARFTIRTHMQHTPIYTDSISHVTSYVRGWLPDVDVEHGARFTFTLGLFLLTADECDKLCVHEVGKNLAALADRMLIDREWDKHVNS